MALKIFEGEKLEKLKHEVVLPAKLWCSWMCTQTPSALGASSGLLLKVTPTAEINTPWCKTLETKQQKPFISNNQPSNLIYLKLLFCVVRDRINQEVWLELNKIWREKMHQNPINQKIETLYITYYREDKYIITQSKKQQCKYSLFGVIFQSFPELLQCHQGVRTTEIQHLHFTNT